MAKKCNEKALGYAGGTLAAICMALLWIGWNIGVYAGAAAEMAKWHLFFSKSVVGLIGGAVEAAIIGFIALYALAWLYNKYD